MEILLGKNKNKESINIPSTINIGIESTTSPMPNEELEGIIDGYEQYLEEKNSSNNYRLIFTINPICSNVLFNAVSEIVYSEGSDECTYFSDKGIFYANKGDIGSSQSYLPKGVRDYCGFLGRFTSDGVEGNNYAPYLTRKEVIRDTAYSHSDIGPLVYHCGYDIFNNHTLRQKKFVIVNKINEITYPMDIRPYFNTIGDFARTSQGMTIRDDIFKQPSDDRLGERLESVETKIHEYRYDDILNYKESIRRNLVEENGWFGFKNKISMPVVNYDRESFWEERGRYNTTLNKTMNNNKPDELYDMYPDRSLFSFMPKKNEHKRRLEFNWDYCITYPCRNEYNNSLVQIINRSGETINGIQCFTYKYDSYDVGDDAEFYEGGNVLFNTFIRHPFITGDKLQFYFLYADGSFKRVQDLVKVESIGNNGDDAQHYFSVRSSDLINYITKDEGEISEIRVAKVVGNKQCEYYFRMFRKLPNFKHTDAYADDEISNYELNRYSSRKFNTSLNKLAFGRNIYSDQMVQIVFNDDVVTTGLKDNLGRDLSEIYFTIVKRNKGWKEWYGIDEEYHFTDSKLKEKNKKLTDFTDKDGEEHRIEFSHCFGKLTEGLDLTDMVYDYNIHLLHNVDVDRLHKYDGKTVNPQNIVNNIRSLNDEGVDFDTDNEFYGDLVEFSPAEYKETVLEEVYHRFNTVQRELVSDEFSGFTYDEIYADDYEILKGDTFCVKEYEYTTNREFGDEKGKKEEYDANIFPEGYYYKPHYRVQLREYKPKVNEGYHTKVYFEYVSNDGSTFNLITIKSPIEINDEKKKGIPTPLKYRNYFFEKMETVFLIGNNGEKIYGHITEVGGTEYSSITVKFDTDIEDIEKYTLFKPNPLMPSQALDMNDLTGKYVWRDTKKCEEYDNDSKLYNTVFTNGAHYRHMNINFYVRRQDPMGIYGLSYQGDMLDNANIAGMIVNGENKEISSYEMKEDESNNVC